MIFYDEWISDSNSTALPQVDSGLGPWAKIGHEDTSIILSLCLFNPQIDVYEVHASGNTKAWVENYMMFYEPEQHSYWTGQAVSGLGADRKMDMAFRLRGIPINSESAQEDRGVLTLQNVANWTKVRTKDKYGAETSQWLDASL